MLVKGMYFSVFYCLCYDTDISTDMSEEQVAEERDPDLNEKEDIILDEIGESIGGMLLSKVMIRGRCIP